MFFSKQRSANLRKELTVTAEILKCAAGVQRDLPRNYILKFRFWQMALICHLALSRLRASSKGFRLVVFYWWNVSYFVVITKGLFHFLKIHQASFRPNVEGQGAI